MELFYFIQLTYSRDVWYTLVKVAPNVWFHKNHRSAQLSNYQFINNMWYKVFKLIMKICNKHIWTKIRT